MVFHLIVQIKISAVRTPFLPCIVEIICCTFQARWGRGTDIWPRHQLDLSRAQAHLNNTETVVKSKKRVGYLFTPSLRRSDRIFRETLSTRHIDRCWSWSASFFYIYCWVHNPYADAALGPMRITDPIDSDPPTPVS